MMPYALGGARLEGSKLVRQIFSDESYSRQGPWFVVAGPIVHADTQLVAVENHIEALAAKYIPEEDRDGFVFHSADIWNNNVYFKDRNKWPRDLCWDILLDLSQIPSKFDLPVCLGIKRKEEGKAAVAREAPQLEGLEAITAHDVVTHGVAFLDFMHTAERFIREAWPDEVAEMVAENRKMVEESIRDVHHNMKTEKRLGKWVVKPTSFPLTHIRGGIKFSPKRDEPLLQVADICAYAILGALEGNLDQAAFYNSIDRMMVAHPKDLSWPPLEWPMGPLVPLWKESKAERESELGLLRRFLRRERRRLRDAGKSNVE